MKKLLLSSLFFGALWGAAFILTVSLIGLVASPVWKSVLYGACGEISVQLGVAFLDRQGFWIGLLVAAISGAGILAVNAATSWDIPDFPDDLSLGWALVGAVCAIVVQALSMFAYWAFTDARRGA